MFTDFSLKVSVDFCRNTPECDTVNVEPYTEDDWEILVCVRSGLLFSFCSAILIRSVIGITCWLRGGEFVKSVASGIP